MEEEDLVSYSVGCYCLIDVEELDDGADVDDTAGRSLEVEVG